MRNNRLRLKPHQLTTFLLLFVAFAVHSQSRSMKHHDLASTTKAARAYVAAFNSGSTFTAPARGLLQNGRPAADAVAILKNGLANASPETRANIVELLADLGLQSRTTLKGTEVIREPSILEALSTAGLSMPDAAMSRAVIVLRQYGMQPELAVYERALAQALAAQPSEELLLLIAKAKAKAAGPAVQQLKLRYEWCSNESLRIAVAALGDKAVEDSFIAAFRSAANPEIAAETLRPLSLIGTRRTMRLIAETLRTPLIIDRPNIDQKSLRLDVLEALCYNFPDEAVLYPDNIRSDRDYAAAEAFCARQFGITYPQSRPPFLTYFGYPR